MSCTSTAPFAEPGAAQPGPAIGSGPVMSTYKCTSLVSFVSLGSAIVEKNNAAWTAHPWIDELLMAATLCESTTSV